MLVLWFYSLSVDSQCMQGTRTKISLFFELQHVLEGTLEIQFPWGREHLCCYNVKFSSSLAPNLVWCLRISFPRVLTWSELPKGQTGRQEIKIFILASARIFLWPWANRFISVQDWNKLLYSTDRHFLFQSTMRRLAWFTYIGFRPKLNLLRLVRGNLRLRLEFSLFSSFFSFFSRSLLSR